MSWSRLKLAAAVLLVVAVTRTVTAPPDETATLIGILKTVDAEKNTVVVMVTRDKDEDLSYTIAKDASVSINGFRLGYQKKEAKLADLKPGMRVRVELSKDKKLVIQIDELRSQQGAQRRDCPKCKSTCGLELSREWCDSFALYKGQLHCWCEIAQYTLGTTGGRSAESQKVKEADWAAVMDKAYAQAKKEGKLLLHIGNTGG